MPGREVDRLGQAVGGPSAGSLPPTMSTFPGAYITAEP